MTVPSEHEHEPRCPYCSHQQSDFFWEYSGEDGDHECGNCSRLFTWSRYIEVTYTTKPIIGPHRLCPSDMAEDAHEHPLEKP